MDKSVKPGVDFFRYANGGWLKRTPIPPEYARWGSFNELIEKNNDALHEIAEKAAKAAPKEESKDAVEQAASADLQKVGDFYASGMDEKEVNAAGVKPLEDEFKRIEAMKDQSDLVKEIGHLHSTGVGALFGFTSGQDDKNSTMVIAQAYQGGLGMPDRDYYLKDDDASKKLRDSIRRACDQDVLASRRFERCRGEKCKDGDGYRDIAGETRSKPSGAARSAEELQQDGAGRSAKTHARF